MSDWLTSAIQSVRDKSLDALDFVRRDLAEFTTTVKTDTESYLTKVRNQEVGDLGINRFVSKLNEVVKTDNDNGKHLHPTPSFDRIHTELSRIQNDESTYLNDPTPAEAYENWLQSTNFNVEARKGDIAQLLIDAPHVRSYYARLVPAQTTHVDFWSRYYYRLHILEGEEARRTQLLKRAHQLCSENDDATGKTNENDWDEPDEEWPKETSSTIPDSILQVLPVEKQDSAEELTPIEQQENTIVTNVLDVQKNERKQSDTVSGDSWEREFDETDVNPSTLPTAAREDPLTNSAETVTSESLSSSTVTTAAATTTTEETPASTSKAQKPPNELDDDWESWS